MKNCHTMTSLKKYLNRYITKFSIRFLQKPTRIDRVLKIIDSLEIISN